MALEFEWDPKKAEANKKKHDVSFEEAGTAFVDPLHEVIADPRPSQGEERFVLFGQSNTGRLLAVMHTERGERIRIISARVATPRERRQHEKGNH
ncbi:MAG: BrnT family toxin [Longimicrobiales bacterium]